MDIRRQTCRVVLEYEASDPDALVITAGEALAAGERSSEWPGWVWCTKASGKGGWVPSSFLDCQGSHCTARHDYDATELTVHAGEMLTASQEEANWVWCTNKEGQGGWVPAKHLDFSQMDDEGRISSGR